MRALYPIDAEAAGLARRISDAEREWLIVGVRYTRRGIEVADCPRCGEPVEHGDRDDCEPTVEDYERAIKAGRRLL